MRAIIALGSNMEDRNQNMSLALRELSRSGIRIIRRSGLYETDPVDVTDQPAFLNAAVEVDTDLSPFELLHTLMTIEQRLGRVRTRPKGPRSIDLDLILYEDWMIGTHRLTVPHPRFHQRAFVLMPMCDLDARRQAPGFHGQTVADLLADCADRVSRPRRLAAVMADPE